MMAIADNDIIQEYNTSMKDIGGVKDINAIFKTIMDYFKDSDSVNKNIITNNEFDTRTVKTRQKIGWAMQKTVLQFINGSHEDLIASIFLPRIPVQDKKYAFFWQIALNNRLFREISLDVFVKNYFTGRAAITNDEIIAFIKEQITGKNISGIKWSEETFYRIATKYLNLMSKLNFVSEGRTKQYNHIRPSAESQALFLYFAGLYAPQSNNILSNRFLPLSFIHEDDIHGRLKKLALKGFFNMNYNGVALNIEFIHDYKGICDVLFK